MKKNGHLDFLIVLKYLLQKKITSAFIVWNHKFICICIKLFVCNKLRSFSASYCIYGYFYDLPKKNLKIFVFLFGIQLCSLRGSQSVFNSYNLFLIPNHQTSRYINEFLEKGCTIMPLMNCRWWYVLLYHVKNHLLMLIKLLEQFK